MKDQVALSIKRVVTNPTTPPRAAHKFGFVRVGTELVLEVGFFDLQDLKTVVDAAKVRVESGEATPDGGSVTLYVTDRFSLTPQGVQDLAQIVKELHADVKEHLLKEPAPEGK